MADTTFDIGPYTFELESYVQLFLDKLKPMELFTVVFMTQGGEQRRYTGHLDPDSTSRSRVVSFYTAEGWKRFDIGRVLWIGREV